MNFFGTDGIRGIANVHPLTPEFAMRIVFATSKIINQFFDLKFKNHLVLIGSDTRKSSPMLSYALASALMSAGLDVINLEIIPTAGLAYLTKKLNAMFSIMVSASHNPYIDNGIKIFGPDGYKLSEEIEEEIEKNLFHEENERPKGEFIGEMKKLSSFVINPIDEYIKYVSSLIIKNAHLKNKLKVVIDCANGAASYYVKKIFKDKFNLITINDNPDGKNINFNCGSTHPENLIKTVIENKADVGIAFDGDADRIILIDEKGQIIDGDHIMAMLAIHLKEEGLLKNNLIVTTVMSNLGFFNAMKKHNIKTITTTVGDRNVLTELLRNDGIIGGEQSGHIILLNKNTTGDGLITATQILNLINIKKQKLSNLANVMQKFPQVLINVPVKKDKQLYKTDQDVLITIKNAEEKLLNRGRVMVRASGTENIIRVMVEGEDKSEIASIAETIANVIKKKFA